MFPNGLKLLIIFSIIVIISSAVNAPSANPAPVKVTPEEIARTTTTTSSGDFKPLQTGPTVITPPTTELTIDSPLKITPAKVGPGDAVNISFRTDYWCASGYNIEVYEDENPQNLICSKTVVGLGWKLGYAYGGVPPCSRHQSNVVKDVCGISTDAIDGSYGISVTIFDREGRLAVQQLKKSAIIVESQKANLVIENFLVTSTSSTSLDIDSGDTLKISGKVLNNGTIAATNFKLGAFFDDSKTKTEFGSFAMSLPALKEQLFDFSLPTSELVGSFIVSVEADSDNELIETTKEDNIASSIVNISSNLVDNPDLFVKDLICNPSDSIKQNNKLDCSAIIGNKGSQPTGSFNVDFISLIDGIPKALASKTVNGLNPETELKVAFFYSIKEKSGLNEYGIKIDPNNSIFESLENNNQKTIKLLVETERQSEEICYDGIDNDNDGIFDNDCEADIALKPISNVSSSNGDSFNVVGNTIILDNTKSKYFFKLDDKSQLGSKTPEEAFFASDLCVKLIKTSGDFSLSLNYGAPENLQFEGLTEFLIPEKYFDFVEDFFSLLSYQLIVDGKRTILPAIASSSLYYNNWKTQGFVLDAEALQLSPGDYSLAFTANCLNRTPEFSQQKNNNSTGLNLKFVTDIEICDGADNNLDGFVDENCDLSIQNFQVFNSPTIPECSLKSSVTVANTGLISSPETTVELFNGFPYTGQPLDSKIVPELAPGETFTANFFGIAPNIATTKLYAIVDRENNFSEVDDNLSPSNNIRREILSVASSEPSFELTDFVLFPTTVKAPAPIQLTATVKNTGFVTVKDLTAEVIVTNPDGVSETKIIEFPELRGKNESSISCNSDFEINAILPSNWNDSTGTKPASFGENGVIQKISFFNSSNDLFIDAIHFKDEFGKCNVTIADSSGVIGFFSGSCNGLTTAPIFSEFPYENVVNSLSWKAIGNLTVDFSNLGIEWKSGDVGRYSISSAKISLQELPPIETKNSKDFDNISFIGANIADIPIPAPIPLIFRAVFESSNQAKLFVETNKPTESCRWDLVSRRFNSMPSANSLIPAIGSEKAFTGIVSAVDGLNKYYVSCKGVSGTAMDYAVLIDYENSPSVSSTINISSSSSNGTSIVSACIGGNQCNGASFLTTSLPNLKLDLEVLRDEPYLANPNSPPNGSPSTQNLVHVIKGTFTNTGTDVATIDSEFGLLVVALSNLGPEGGSNYICVDGLCYYCDIGQSFEDCRDSYQALSAISKNDVLSFIEIPPAGGAPPGSPVQRVVLGEIVISSNDFPNGFIDIGESFDFEIPIPSGFLVPEDNSVEILIDAENTVEEDQESDNSGDAGFGGLEGLQYPGTCFDFIDNDGDGYIDFDDSDCIGPGEETICNDGIDNDGDGLIDLDDPDCVGPPTPDAEICGNGIDEDGDGVDAVCPDVELQGEETNSEGEICGDGIDNDLDGRLEEGCREGLFEEICDNGIDDNGNGLIDESPPCVLEIIEPIINILILLTDERSVGQEIAVTVISEDGVPLAGSLIKVITPSGNIFYLEIKENGRVSFIIEEAGEFSVIVFFKGQEKQVKFNAIAPFALQFGVISDLALNAFGETVKENIWFVPLLAFISLLAGYLAFGISNSLFASPKSSQGRRLLKARAYLAAVVFFILPFVVNKSANFSSGLGVAILELLFLFALSYYFKLRVRSSRKLGKI